MYIKYSQTFHNAFKKLSHVDKECTLSTLELFRENPFCTSLHNHPLGRNMTGDRAISVGNDLRIIFRERGEYTEIIMLNIGTHMQIYL